MSVAFFALVLIGRLLRRSSSGSRVLEQESFEWDIQRTDAPN